MTTINKDALTEVKGLGPAKADAILAHLDGGGSLDVASIASIKGVSEDLAKRAVKALKQANVSASLDVDDSTHETASAEVTETAEVEVSTNGHHTAGEVRRFARTAQEFGFGDLAESLFEAAAQSLDDEQVEISFG